LNEGALGRTHALSSDFGPYPEDSINLSRFR
jgi:hypothetical protein